MSESTKESFQVLRAQLGDREALDALLRGIQRPVYGYLKNMVRDSAVAEDTLQDVFVIVIRKLKTLRDPQLFRPWVYRIASRQALKTLRRETRWRNRVVESVSSDTPYALQSPDAGDVVDAREIKELLDRLSPPVRAVMVLHYLESMSLKDVGAILGLPVGTVKSRLANGLQKLRGIVCS